MNVWRRRENVRDIEKWSGCGVVANELPKTTFYASQRETERKFHRKLLVKVKNSTRIMQ